MADKKPHQLGVLRYDGQRGTPRRAIAQEGVNRGSTKPAVNKPAVSKPPATIFLTGTPATRRPPVGYKKVKLRDF